LTLPLTYKGRGLRVRKDRLVASRGMSLPEIGVRVACGLMMKCVGQAQAVIAGVRSPPLRGGVGRAKIS